MSMMSRNIYSVARSGMQRGVTIRVPSERYLSRKVPLLPVSAHPFFTPLLTSRSSHPTGIPITLSSVVIPDVATLHVNSVRFQHHLCLPTMDPGNGKGVKSASPVPPPPQPPPTQPSSTSPLPPPAVRPSGPSQPPRPPKKEPFKKVTNFIFSKFLNFVQGYQAIMERRFPQVMQVYRVFVVGFKDFSKDLADYVKIKTKVVLSSSGVLSLNRTEIDIYYRMPKEIFRVGPTLILSALPGFQYIMFPIAYKFPRTLLSSHFWSLQQKSEFAIESQRKRLFNQRPVLRQMQSSVDSIQNEKLRELCRDVLLKLGSGSHPSVREIMKIKPLFESDPFSIKAMHGPHIKSLCRLHGIHTWYLNRRRLMERAEMIYFTDLLLMRDGISTLKGEDLKSACFLRGLNAANTKHEDMVEFLQQWASISSSIQPHCYSLLLHLPVLLAYNNPNNWALLS